MEEIEQFFQQIVVNDNPVILGETEITTVSAWIKKDDSQLVAVKTVTTKNQELIQQISQEIKMLKSLKGNPYIVQHLYDNSYTQKISKQNYYVQNIAMEYGTSIQKIINSRYQSGLKFTQAELYCLVDGILRAGQELEDLHIVHRDIKPDNLLFSSLDFKVKLADFGEAKRLSLST